MGLLTWIANGAIATLGAIAVPFALNLATGSGVLRQRPS
jgi:hypothetical protein